MYHLIKLLLISIFIGCSAPKSYILENKNIPATNTKIDFSIGIKTIELPQYLQGQEIPYLKNGNQIVYLKDKRWATYLDEHLTNRIISTLQKAFNTPKVYKYPQNTSTKPDIVINIVINKFIANNKFIILDATCKQVGKRESKERLFNIKEPIKSKDDIIDGMNRAFGKLEAKLIQYLSILQLNR